jgi:hypothetical protein
MISATGMLRVWNSPVVASRITGCTFRQPLPGALCPAASASLFPSVWSRCFGGPRAQPCPNSVRSQLLPSRQPGMLLPPPKQTRALRVCWSLSPWWILLGTLSPSCGWTVPVPRARTYLAARRGRPPGSSTDTGASAGSGPRTGGTRHIRGRNIGRRRRTDHSRRAGGRRRRCEWRD